jgi:hypothetical protein
MLDDASPKGIITPRQDGLTISGIRFYNYDWNNAAAFGSCSHCFHSGSTDSGARTVHVNNLWFDTTVPRKIRYMPPLKAIFHDEDGTLTGKGANSFATYFYEHHNQPECEHLEDEYNGVTCDNTVQIRRVAFWDSGPGVIFDNMGFKLLRYDDDLIGAMDEVAKKTYIDD